VGVVKTEIAVVSEHLKNIYAEGELTEEATIKEYLIVRREGVTQNGKNEKGEQEATGF
jgi:hypothetical protein